MIDFLAYDSADHVLHGRIELQGDRLADLLASRTTLEVEGLRVVPLTGKEIRGPASRTVRLGDLCVVVASGPAGSQYKRIQTVYSPVTIHAGPYLVHGYLHAPPPESPIKAAEQRTWLALTEGVLEYTYRWQAIRERHDVLLVNRLQAKALIVTDERSHESRWLAGKDPVDWPPTLDDQPGQRDR
jgi:hypothetical protein